MKFSLTHFICAMCCFAVCGLRAATETAGAPRDIVALPTDFPTHWTQYDPYRDFALEPFGVKYQPGCVAIAGASSMEALQWPLAFGEDSVIFDIERELRAGPIDWPSMSPTPNRPDGMATVYDILYNLGLLSDMHYGANESASTTPLANLGTALRHSAVGYASAYTVPLNLDATSQDDIEAAVWASIRCGSPVPLSLDLGYGAHAVVAYGCGTDAQGDNPRTAIFLGYGGAGFWDTLPRINRYPATGGKLDYALAAMVAQRPEGVTRDVHAFPIIGTVVDGNGAPIPYAPVTLERDGVQIASTLTDHAGRYGLWGWFDGAHTVRCGNASQSFPTQKNKVYIGNDAPRMTLADLKAVVSGHETVLSPTDIASFIVHTVLDDAIAAADGNYILCIRPQDNDDRQELREAVASGALDNYTLWYSHPTVGEQVDTMASRPTAKAFILTSQKKIITFCSEEQPLADWLAGGVTAPVAQRIAKSCRLSESGFYAGSDLTLAEGVSLILDKTLRAGTLTTEGVAALTANTPAARLDVASFVLGGPLTVSGTRVDFEPTESIATPLTLSGGAKMILRPGINLSKLTLSGADLIVPSGAATLPTTLTIQDSATVTAEGNASLTLSDKATLELSNANTVLTWTAPLNGSGSLTVTTSAEGSRLSLRNVNVPVIVQGPARLDGGSLGGNLGLSGGAALASGRLLAVSGTVIATDPIPVSGTRVGTFLETASSLDPKTFTVEEGFGVERTALADGRYAYRLISVGVTPPTVYADGALTEAEALPEANRARNLLILTPRQYKEMGYWESYAAWKSSEAGGSWTVMVASPSNIPENTTMEAYVASQPADYVILGATSATNAVDGQDNLWLADLSSVPAGTAVGRIPLVPELTLPYRPQSGGVSTKTLTAEEQIAGYATKSARALAPWQPGRMLCIGTAFKETSGPYVSSTDYTAFDGLPPMAEWDYVSYFPKHSALAMREHYRQLCLAKPARKPFVELGFSADGIGSGNANVGTAAIQTREGAVLWTEGAGTNAAVAATLSCALDGNTRANIAYVGDMTGLHALALMPVGQSASMPLLTETAPTAGIGMALVLNPAGGALAALAVPEAYEAVVLQDGTVDYTLSAAHNACLNILKRLVADPQLTVGEAFAEEKTSALTLFGDPTVRIAPFTMPGWILKLK